MHKPQLTHALHRAAMAITIVTVQPRSLLCARDAASDAAHGLTRVPLGRPLPPTQEGDCPFHCHRPFCLTPKGSIRAQLPKATEGFGGGWMLAFCSRPKPLVMKNLTPYLYLTLGREGIGRTTLSNPLDLIICPDASRGDGEYTEGV